MSESYAAGWRKYIITPASVSMGAAAAIIGIVDFSKIFDSYPVYLRVLLALVFFLLILLSLSVWNILLLSRMIENGPYSKNATKIISVTPGQGVMQGRVIITISKNDSMAVGQIILVKRKIANTGSFHEIGMIEVISVDAESCNCVVFKPFNQTVDSMESFLSNGSIWQDVVITSSVLKNYL